MKKKAQFALDVMSQMSLLVQAQLRDSAAAGLRRLTEIECQVDSQVVWKPRKSNCFGTCEGLNLERTQPLWSKLAFGGGWDVQVVSG